MPPENPEKGDRAMKVRAKQNVRDASGWHLTGCVFETEEDLGAAVEVLDAPKRRPEPEPKPVEAAPAEEPKQEPEKTKSASRRKKTGS